MTSNEKLAHKRHTLAHLLAATVREMYPGAQNAIGPAVDNGFYQDFDLPIAISDADLPKIEEGMKRKLKAWKEFERKEVNKEEALQEFAWNKYKSELIEEFAGEGKNLTFYTVDGFIDLCKGGHSENPAKEIDLDSFKLSRVAGAYWRGDEKNKMLTRIYGLAFENKEALDAYEKQIEEAEKRDHKKIGKEMGLFVFSPLIGAGLPLWTPKGTIMRGLLDDYVWELRRAKGYQKVTIPHITKKDLYDTSGHWAKYADDLFKIKTREDHLYAMKPMNCPHHTQIFDAEQRSYRDMPQRYAETTMVYRDEQSGELSGLSRVLSITQDDAHVFCRENQIEDEALAIWEIIEKFYGTFGFDLTVRFSRHDPAQKEKYMGESHVWHKAESALESIMKKKGVEWIDGLGEAAFYGPKIDFIAKDAIGRVLQVATIQLDFNMPANFGLFCINEKGEKEQVVMIHAAIMGSIERFMATLIEHTAGVFPLWLSPVQVKIIPIGENEIEYAKTFEAILKENNIRAEIDLGNDSFGKKIRNAKTEKIPYLAVIGKKEVESGTVTLEARTGSLGALSKDEILKKLIEEIKERK